jgi:hypothetical protein
VFLLQTAAGGCGFACSACYRASEDLHHASAHGWGGEERPNDDLHVPSTDLILELVLHAILFWCVGLVFLENKGTVDWDPVHLVSAHLDCVLCNVL